MFLVVFIGCANVSYALVGVYMVSAGYVQAGQPMYLDELAPDTKEAAIQILFGTVLITVALLSRAAIRRRLAPNAA